MDIDDKYEDDYDEYEDDEVEEYYDDVEDYSQEDVIPPLRYTPDEIFAIQVYESAPPNAYGPLSMNPKGAYRTMNVMLFPGLDNELARIFDDRYTQLNVRSNSRSSRIARTIC